MLQRPTAKVTDFGPALKKLLGEMMESLREAECSGQIGVALRVDLGGPELLEKSEPVTYEEGCLSMPGELAIRTLTSRYITKPLPSG